MKTLLQVLIRIPEMQTAYEYVDSIGDSGDDDTFLRTRTESYCVLGRKALLRARYMLKNLTIFCCCDNVAA